MLGIENIKALDNWETRIDHCRKLPAENNYILPFYFGLHERDVFKKVLGFLLDLGRSNLTPDKFGTHSFFGRGLHLTFLFLILSVLPLPQINWHDHSPLLMELIRKYQRVHIALKNRV
jgi:hypothetical protein